MDSVKLSIVIVNYNGKHFLAECFASIAQHVTCSHEIIVVDNASADGSAEYISSHFPHVRLIASNENGGFAKGNNLAARSAVGEYLLLLNNDTVLKTDLAAGISLLETDPQAGVIGARMFGKNQEYRLSAGYFPSPLRLIKIASLYKRDGIFSTATLADNPSAEAYPVDWVEGSFMLMKLSLWKTLKGLDETYFMYGEDVDFCKRVQLLGLQCLYLPALKFIHYGGYGAARLPMIINGFVKYHLAHSDVLTRTAALVVLSLKVFLTQSVSYLLYLFTRKQKFKDKSAVNQDALLVLLGRR